MVVKEVVVLDVLSVVLATGLVDGVMDTTKKDACLNKEHKSIQETKEKPIVGCLLFT